MSTRITTLAMFGALSFAIAFSAYFQIDTPAAPASGYGVDREASVALAGPG
jgi:hypothetical protein